MCFLQHLLTNATLAKTRMKIESVRKKSREINLPITANSYSDEGAGFEAESVL
jgi:hypothetical protein